MPLYKGSSRIEDIFVGNTQIGQIYYGSTLVYESFKQQSFRFNYTGGVQTFTVPRGCKTLILDCCGAGGGNGDMYHYVNNDYIFSAVPGGAGGRVRCKLSVSAGQTLYLYVGGRGSDSPLYAFAGDVAGGFNGGGTGSVAQEVPRFFTAGGGGGGGATDIRTGSALSTRLVVAGGGAGGFGTWQYATGGNGGGLVGEQGLCILGDENSARNAGGGTQSEGGVGGSANFSGKTEYGYAGSLGYGGSKGSVGFASGGGGGYYGGGSNVVGVGGGGSSYTDSSLCSSVVHTQGANSGNGWIIVTTSK